MVVMFTVGEMVVVVTTLVMEVAMGIHSDTHSPVQAVCLGILPQAGCPVFFS